MNAIRRPSALLVVEDDEGLRQGFVTALTAWAGKTARVESASSVAEARERLRSFRPEVVLLDVMLPDGSAFEVLDEIDLVEPAPRVIAMSGGAALEQCFRLAQRGVTQFLGKPIALETLEATLAAALTATPDLRPQLRLVVGHRPVHAVEEQVRSVMVGEALARAGGSRRKAARLLSVSRQLLQHIIRKLNDAA